MSRELQTERIKQRFLDAGIFCVMIESAPKFTIVFDGDFDDFIKAVKALGESVVFLTEYHFDESYFNYTPDDGKIYGHYQQEADNDEMDLRIIQPELASFLDYVDKTTSLFCRVFFNNQQMLFVMKAEWFEEFNQEFEKAAEVFQLREAEAKDLVLNESKRRKNGLLQLLGTLADDQSFIALKTQKAKLEYALALYPGLKDDLEPPQLKEEISNITARIEAQRSLHSS